MNKLYTDLQNDKERAEFFKSGEAWKSGIVSKSIENDIAELFEFRDSMRWISIHEQIPYDGTIVNVLYAGHVYTGYIFDSIWNIYPINECIPVEANKITHWIHLPKPIKND